MDKEKVVWFLAGIAASYAYHKFVKAVPGKSGQGA